MFDLLKTTIGRLRIIGFTEGVSYIVLLFVAMPLKYILGMPEAVRMFGSIHGALFVAYVLYVVLSHVEYEWQFSKSLKLFLISLVPFGNFYADKKWLRFEKQ
jgi:integral membrane protein